MDTKRIVSARVNYLLNACAARYSNVVCGHRGHETDLEHVLNQALGPFPLTCRDKANTSDINRKILSKQPLRT